MDPLHGDVGHAEEHVKIESCARGRIHYKEMRDILKNITHIISYRERIHYIQ
jgi:hypothetical protein